MAPMLRCRSCGYVIAEAKLKGPCPACGFARKQFAPWTDPLAPHRRARLDLALHPMVLHFAVAFTVSAFALALLAIFFPGFLAGLAGNLLLVMTAVLPVSVIAAVATGIFDGGVRFRRVTTPALVRKIAMGSSVFVETLAAAVLLFAFGLGPLWVRIVAAALLGTALGAVAVLAKLGEGLREAAIPG